MARQPAGSSGADRAARSPSWAGQVEGSPPVRPAARAPVPHAGPRGQPAGFPHPELLPRRNPGPLSIYTLSTINMEDILDKAELF